MLEDVSCIPPLQLIPNDTITPHASQVTIVAAPHILQLREIELHDFQKFLALTRRSPVHVMDRKRGKIASVRGPEDLVPVIEAVALERDARKRETRKILLALGYHRTHVKALDDKVTDMLPAAMQHLLESGVLTCNRV